MELIRTKDVVKIAGVKNLGGMNTARFVMSVLKLDKINDIYSKHYYKPASIFIDSVLDDTKIKFHFNDGDLAKIPSTGPFIIVSNHPFGGIEGLILLKKIILIRPDFKIIGNFLFNHIDPVREYMFAVNPFETKKEMYSSVSGLRNAFSHVKNGHPLAIFPAGEVSTWYNDSKHVADRDWNQSIIRFIKYAEVPIVPVYFHGSNSLMFHLMGMVHPMLRTARIPTELLNKHKEIIHARVGTPIEAKDIPAFSNTNDFGSWLRARTYLLEAGVKAFVPKTKDVSLTNQTIAPPVPKKILRGEIERISEEYVLHKHLNFSMYCVPTPEIPNILLEIGRLREETFRAVGEGTGKSVDIDSYDCHFHQLFIWDHKNECVVGGYRIGKGKDIMALHGLKGFYIHSLFRMSDRMKPMLQESIELGRSFIVNDYQRKPMSLFMLWKGILYFLLKNKEYRYMIGPVSISNSYTDLSKKVLIEWINSYHKADNFENLIFPRCPYKPMDTRTNTAILVEKTKNAILLDQLIAEIEPAGTRMPVLLKKYLSIGAKIACFNMDPLFNNCIDSLLMLDSKDVPSDMVQTLSKELHSGCVAERQLM